ncbi:hypothetical protein IWX49DRAFT_567104, partial [Phyllosticta citricarpa]
MNTVCLALWNGLSILLLSLSLCASGERVRHHASGRGINRTCFWRMDGDDVCRQIGDMMPYSTFESSLHACARHESGDRDRSMGKVC